MGAPSLGAGAGRQPQAPGLAHVAWHGTPGAGATRRQPPAQSAGTGRALAPGPATLPDTCPFRVCVHVLVHVHVHVASISLSACMSIRPFLVNQVSELFVNGFEWLWMIF